MKYLVSFQFCIVITGQALSRDLQLTYTMSFPYVLSGNLIYKSGFPIKAIRE
jgi:hypothetical protein